ncbi:MAG: hypothetical protein JSR98_05120 [Proteobacteria bacterium]|nr:hypothetical protein [Pseudomonadota bacterium]
MADGSGAALERLIRSTNPAEQQTLRAALRDDGDYLADLTSACLRNPFLRLSDEDAAAMADQALPGPLGALLAARQAAMSSVAPRYTVFCMPKSGSSFVQSALQHALQLPFVSLTTVGSGYLSSYFGMNAREQELDELAMVKAILEAPNGWVAQHHTRYTQYLALQLNAYSVKPVVTVRNILDCLVSFDDMMLAWRAQNPPQIGWLADPYVLPHDYPQRDPADRYRLLAPTLGIWLIRFFLTWKRGIRQGIVKPLVIQYDHHLLAPARFVETVCQHLDLTQDQRARLEAYALNPDPGRSRLNVGEAGRGRKLVPVAVRSLLLDYASGFGDEISPAELAYLLD